MHRQRHRDSRIVRASGAAVAGEAPTAPSAANAFIAMTEDTAQPARRTAPCGEPGLEVCHRRTASRVGQALLHRLPCPSMWSRLSSADIANTLDEHGELRVEIVVRQTMQQG